MGAFLKTSYHYVLRYIKAPFLSVFIIGFLIIGCNQPIKYATATDSLKKNLDQTIPGSFAEKSDFVFDSTQIADFFKTYPKVKSYEQDIRSFYRKRNFSYAWFDKGELIEQAGNLSNRLMNLENDGVYKQLSYLKALDSLMYGSNNKDDKEKRPDIVLELVSIPKKGTV
ncbi:MAG: hypothetical protein JWQ14_633 [Adhaeribacter sp.]|nr:hypothetical protein [Adhaeribacter sp.]